MNSNQVMSVAQSLYQAGHITYMRTDGTQISNEAISSFRDYINKNYGKKYLPEAQNNYSGKKAKNAQEAHEAIRPTEISRSPTDIKKYLNSDQFKLYELIWNRALSSQMQSAEYDRNTILISSKDENIKFRSSGSVLKFNGFLKLYKDIDNKEEKSPLAALQYIDNVRKKLLWYSSRSLSLRYL